MTKKKEACKKWIIFGDKNARIECHRQLLCGCHGCFLAPNGRPLPHCQETVRQGGPTRRRRDSRPERFAPRQTLPVRKHRRWCCSEHSQSGEAGGIAQGWGRSAAAGGVASGGAEREGARGAEVVSRTCCDGQVVLSPAPLGRARHPCCAHHLCRFVNNSRNSKLPVYYFSGRTRWSDAKIDNCFCGTLFKNQYVLYLKWWQFRMLAPLTHLIT